MTGLGLRAQARICLCLVGLLAPASLRAADEGPEEEELPAPATLKWVDPFGNDLPMEADHESKWLWRKPDLETMARESGGPPVTPSFRTEIRAPSDLRFLEAKSADSEVKLFERGALIRIDSRRRIATLEITFRRRIGQKTKASLAVKPVDPNPMLWVNAGCREAGMALYVRKSLVKGTKIGDFLYAAAACTESADSIQLYMLHSEDADWHGTSFGRPLRTGKGWALYHVSKPKEMKVKRRIVGKFTLSDAGTDNR
ncbi:MAG: hypothetical protein IT285_07725, partial [Bdellovibrionales bacterium]|nr:hypothetical protein [Bdellovibrionales bacterium]